METLPWFERNLRFGYGPELLPFFMERLKGSPIRAAAKVKGISEEILSTRVNGKWSIKQEIGHLAEVDEIANKRLDEMVAGVAILSPAVFEPADYNAWTMDRVLNLLNTNREKNLRKYESLSHADLIKSSLHPRLKVQMTPVDLAWFDAEHDDHHLVKVNQLLLKLKQQA
jgi:uncharacterized damage-inducible protein DinB